MQRAHLLAFSTLFILELVLTSENSPDRVDHSAEEILQRWASARSLSLPPEPFVLRQLPGDSSLAFVGWKIGEGSRQANGNAAFGGFETLTAAVFVTVTGKLLCYRRYLVREGAPRSDAAELKQFANGQELVRSYSGAAGALPDCVEIAMNQSIDVCPVLLPRRVSWID